jgi:uncharacterized membrane protein
MDWSFQEGQNQTQDMGGGNFVLEEGTDGEPMKDSKRLRLRGVAWTILGLAFMLMILLAVTDGNWRTSIVCLVCFLGFTGAFGKAQKFFGVADFVAGHEAMEESFKKPFGDRK